MRVYELYSGIGGMHFALKGLPCTLTELFFNYFGSICVWNYYEHFFLREWNKCRNNKGY